ncbi:hypothetical protein V3M68_02890 [Trueperella pyogenes]|uniref:VG15 protein n=1 Tax=Trueperella pyogenes TaxID=1661 RepID=UPI00345CC153
MAETNEGRGLTETHRRAQARLAGSIQAAAPELDALIDVGRLDATFPDWYMGLSALRESGRAASTRLASAYVSEFGRAEAGVELMAGRQRVDVLAEARDAHMDAVIMVKSRVAQGMDVQEAWRIQAARVYAKLGQAVLGAGRGVVTTANFRYSGKRGRWRRVSDGAPCAFCAMLVGRGPVYQEHTVQFRSHNHCGCSAEPVLGDWEPSEVEALWRASYLQAALDAEEEFGSSWARTAAGEDNILARMRRNSPTLFHDGVFDKKTPARSQAWAKATSGVRSKVSIVGAASPSV